MAELSWAERTFQGCPIWDFPQAKVTSVTASAEKQSVLWD